MEHGGIDMSAAVNRRSEIARAFAETGCLVLPDFLSRDELSELNSQLDAHFAPLLQEAERHRTAARDSELDFECDVICWNPCGEGNPTFTALRDDSRLAAVTEDCLGPGFTATGSLIMCAVGHGRGQSWHQDCPPKNAAAFNCNRLFYTEDVSLGDGAIVVVPGSHRCGLIPEGDHQESMENEIVLTPQAGTLVMLNGHVYHRVTPNTTGRRRFSVNFRAFPANVSAGICNIGVYRTGAVDFSTGSRVDRASLVR